MKYYTSPVLFLVFCFVINHRVCAQKNYFEQKAFPVIMHDHKNQLAVTVGCEKGFDLGLSYSLTNHISLFGSATMNKKLAVHSTFFDFVNIRMNDHSYVSGLNYSMRIKSDLVKRLNIYTAFSSTTIDNYWNFVAAGPLDELVSPYTKAKYNSVYLGADIVYDNKNMEVAWTLRYCNSNYGYLVFSDKTDPSSDAVSTANNLKSNNLETYVSVAGKWKSFKICGQAGYSRPLKDPYASQTDSWSVGPTVYVFTNRELYNQASGIGRLSIQYNFDFRGEK
jgi:hypothetical protein